MLGLQRPRGLQLRHAGIVESRRGADGGYKLARPPEEITLADVIRAIDGPLAGVSGQRPEGPRDTRYDFVAPEWSRRWPCEEIWRARLV